MIWLALGFVLTALPLATAALIAVTVYGCGYGLIEVSGRGGLPPPGRRWQVPQTMLIGASPRKRVMVWGAILGPGLLTRNPYAGFAALPLAVAAMPGPAAGPALGAAVGMAHAAARAAGLLRDLSELRSPVPVTAVATAGPGGAAVPTHLDLLLKTIYWRRADGVLLLAAAAAAAAIAAGHLA